MRYTLTTFIATALDGIAAPAQTLPHALIHLVGASWLRVRDGAFGRERVRASDPCLGGEIRDHVRIGVDTIRAA